MSKRFTDTGKWEKPWFRKLSPAEKAAWQYITDRCDNVGVWDADYELADFIIGEPIDWDGFAERCNGNIKQLDNGKWWLVDYCAFQHPDLSEDSKSNAIQSYVQLLKKHGLWDLVETADKKGLGKTHSISAATRSYVIERDGMVCAYCGKSVTNFEINLDHVIPRSKGGGDKPDNIVVSCRSCNKHKSDFDLEEFLDRADLDKESAISRVTERLQGTLLEGFTIASWERERERERERVEEQEPSDFRDAADEVIDYLNETAGSHFKSIDTNRKGIIARLNDGYTVDDCKAVVGTKCAEWLDSDMAKHLNPETLFRPSKFEKYLNQAKIADAPYDDGLRPYKAAQ